MTNAEKIRRAAEQGLRGPSDRGEYRICCPMCPADAKYKMQLNPAKGLFHCYKCGAGGRVDLSWLEPLAELDPDAVAKATPSGSEFLPPPGFVPFAGNEGSRVLAPYRQYVDRRGLLSAFMSCWGGACVEGPYAGRVVVPHVSERFASALLGSTQYLPTGISWRGFAARSIYAGVEPKYLYPRGMDRRGSLWGGFLPLTPRLYLVEGVFDAMALYPYGVASFGKDVTDEQLTLFIQWCGDTEGVVCLDGDAWEEGAATYARLRLRGMNNVKWCKLPPGTDPGVLGMRVAEFIRG